MVQYRYAFNSSNNIVIADSLAGTEITDTYSCIACSQPLVARVNGLIQRPHFGHKVSVECNGETYLHRLAKQVFKETYENCLDKGEPFTISFDTPRCCSKFKRFTGKCCELGEESHEYDLTQYYSKTRTETRDGQFIPDISLHSIDRPTDVVYVEIAVSHFLSEAKAASANRIIEITINSEEDVDIIRKAHLSSENVSFVGFHPNISTVPDAECKCAREHVFAFYVFTTGKAYLDDGQLRVLSSKIQRRARELKYVNIIRDKKKSSSFEVLDRTRAEIFIDEVRLAHKRGVPIKNCYLCRYHGNNWSALSDESIFCKTYNKTCTSSEAAVCDRYYLP